MRPHLSRSLRSPHQPHRPMRPLRRPKAPSPSPRRQIANLLRFRQSLVTRSNCRHPLRHPRHLEHLRSVHRLPCVPKRIQRPPLLLNRLPQSQSRQPRFHAVGDSWHQLLARRLDRLRVLHPRRAPKRQPSRSKSQLRQRHASHHRVALLNVPYPLQSNRSLLRHAPQRQGFHVAASSQHLPSKPMDRQNQLLVQLPARPPPKRPMLQPRAVKSASLQPSRA